MSFESLTLTEIRQELQRLNIDVSTGSLRGEERKAALLERLKLAKPPDVAPAQQQYPKARSTHEPSQRLPMHELRAKCESLGISTLTHGLTGEDRYQELMKRTSIKDESVTENQTEAKTAQEFAEDITPFSLNGNIHFGGNELGEEDEEEGVTPSISWGGNRMFMDDDSDEEDNLHNGDNIVVDDSDDSDEDHHIESHKKSYNGGIEFDSHQIVQCNESEEGEVIKFVMEDREGDSFERSNTVIEPISQKTQKKMDFHEPTIKPSLILQHQDMDGDPSMVINNHNDDTGDDEVEEEVEDEEYDGFDVKLDDKQFNIQKLNLSTVTQRNQKRTESSVPKQDSPAPYPPASSQQDHAGAGYFASLLTPRLSCEELSRRLRVIKREIRSLLELRANAIGARSHGPSADLDVMTADKQHQKVQAELKRVRSEEQMYSSHKSRLVDAGRKMSFTDLQFKLVTMEVALVKQLTEARKLIVREENKDPAHGSDAEMAMNAQIVVLTRALANAKEEEEKERLSRYEIESTQSTDSPYKLVSPSDKVPKEQVWHPPGGPPLTLENPQQNPNNITLEKPQQNPNNKDVTLVADKPLTKSNKPPSTTPGELLLQKALKLMAQDPNTAKKKKLLQENSDQVEKTFKESLKYARVSSHTDPSLLPRVLMHWASFIWHQKDDIKEAGQVYKEACELAQKSSMGRVQASVCAEYAGFLSKCREFDQAEQIYLKGLSGDATHPRLLGNYARLLTNRGEYARADALFSQALSSAPLHGPTMINRAQLLKTLGKLDEAETLLRKAATECSEVAHRAQGANNLANFLWRVKGDLVGAKQAYLDGLKVKGLQGDKLLQRNYAMFLSRNKEMRSNTSPLSELPGRDSLGVLEEAEDPYEEMSTLDAAVVQRIVASNRASQISETFEED